MASNNINQFFKENRKDKKKELFAVSQRFTDDNGEALKWELRPCSTKKVEAIRNQCISKDGVSNGAKFALLLSAATVSWPNLNDSSLQDSYGGKKAEDLLYELVYPAELDVLEAKCLEINGYSENLETLVEQAKN